MVEPTCRPHGASLSQTGLVAEPTCRPHGVSLSQTGLVVEPTCRPHGVSLSQTAGWWSNRPAACRRHFSLTADAGKDGSQFPALKEETLISHFCFVLFLFLLLLFCLCSRTTLHVRQKKNERRQLTPGFGQRGRQHDEAEYPDEGDLSHHPLPLVKSVVDSREDDQHEPADRTYVTSL